MTSRPARSPGTTAIRLANREPSLPSPHWGGICLYLDLRRGGRAAELEALDLAGGGLRKLLHEVEVARALEVGKPVAHVNPQRLFHLRARVGARLQHFEALGR